MDVMQELQSFLVTVGDFVLEDVAVPHSLQPLLGDFLGAEITFNVLLLLFRQELLLVLELVDGDGFIAIDYGILGLDDWVL
jgi:hypothetical protein